MDQAELKAALLAERRAFYARARGGASLPAAGALYWGVLAAIGWAFPAMHIPIWNIIAFAGSGLIFPLGLLLQAPLRSSITEKSPLGGLVAPGLTAMGLSWVVTLSLFVSQPEMVPLALAVGMSLHWPVIGWMYGRMAPFLVHAAARAVACMTIWFVFPAQVTTLLPASVCAIYIATVVFILIDATAERRRLGMA